LGWYVEMSRNQRRLGVALEECRTGKLSGAVGVNAHWAPDFEERVLARLGLRREPVSTQVIPRDRHLQVLHAMACIGNSMERIAVELRHLQRSEVAEVMEGFARGQKGSSAMPHKRNPISSENLTGIARLLRAYAQTGHENVALWHERDISHSSVERITFPDSMMVLDYAVARLKGVIEGLVVRRQNVEANLKKAGSTAFSGHFLLALVDHGVSREEAYAWVQECALQDLEGKGAFLALLKKHPRIAEYLGEREIDRLGSMKHQLRHVREIYRRAFAEARG
jgi:adenylosuccinate lyase